MKKFTKKILVDLLATLGLSALTWLCSLIRGQTLSLFAYLVVFVVSLVIVIACVFFYSSWKANQIGYYSFNTLYKILKTEFVHETTIGMDWRRQEPPKQSLIEQFEMFHVTLSAGVDINAPYQDAGYLYSILCPKLYAYGLLSKERVEPPNPSFENYRYQLSEDGKKFWARLTELQLKGSCN